jgi:O-antigen/teichoic acid export membrane protein
MQWRIALSWASGYFVFSIFTPVLFWYHGPVVAGQMGMTWSLVNAMQIAVSWLAPRVPQFGILVAKRQYDELDHLLWRLTYIIVTIGVAAAFCIWLFVYVLYEYGFHLATRLLPPLPTALLLLAQLLVVISLPFSSYMRAHKTEPIVHISVLGAVLSGISAMTLGKYYAANGMALGYLLINVILIPFVLLIWCRLSAEWRLANSSTPGK